METWKREPMLVVAVTALLILVGGATLAREKLGTPGNDRIIGTNRSDFLAGLGGSDRLLGRGEGDVLFGDGQCDLTKDGNDRVFGQAGTDRIAGFGGSDMLNGGDGDDFIFAEEDFLVGEGCSADYPAPPFGRDTVIGGEGNDNIDAVDGAPDAIDCGPGEDFVQFDSGGTDTVENCESVSQPSTVNAPRHPSRTPHQGTRHRRGSAPGPGPLGEAA